MNYIKGNKEAWEEVFEHREDGWGEYESKTFTSFSHSIYQIINSAILAGLSITH